MTKLSDTQRVILSKAAQHDALLANPPAKLPAAARQAVLRSMIGKDLLEEVPAPREAIGLGWRQDEDGAWTALRITAAGLAAIGVEPESAADVPDAELGGLTPAEFEEEQNLAQAALDAGIDLSLDPQDDRPRDERNGVDPALVIGDLAEGPSSEPAPPEMALLPPAPLEGSLAAFPPAPPSSSGEAPEGRQRAPVSQRGPIGYAAALREAFHYPGREACKAHVLAFVTAYNFAKHLKALGWRTPFQSICDAWQRGPAPFKINPHHFIRGPNT